MTHIEALKLALEALESGVKTTANRISWTEYDCELMEQAITAIKKAEGGICPSPPAQQEYERGFIDGMQEQMKRSVDRAVNAMAQRTWVGLTSEQIQHRIDTHIGVPSPKYPLDSSGLIGFALAIEHELKGKNT